MVSTKAANDVKATAEARRRRLEALMNQAQAQAQNQPQEKSWVEENPLDISDPPAASSSPSTLASDDNTTTTSSSGHSSGGGSTSRGTPFSARAYAYTPSQNSILTRQFFSIVLVILLYTAAMPFEPFAWTLGRISGTYLFDRLLAGLLLFIAFYFQWQIASLKASVIVNIPSMGATTRINNGRVEKDGWTTTPVWVWRTKIYWHFALAEAALLVLAEWGPSETLRRLIVTGVLAGLWVVGWAATPESLKRWAWTHIKAYLFVLVLDELRRVAWNAIGANSGGRRARQARW